MYGSKFSLRNYQRSTVDIKSRYDLSYFQSILLKTSLLIISALGIFLFTHFDHTTPKLLASYGANIWVLIGSLTLGLILYCGNRFFLGAWTALLKHQATLDSLVALSMLLMWGYAMTMSLHPETLPGFAQHFQFSGILIILSVINISFLLDSYARSKTTRDIAKLWQLLPKQANLYQNKQVHLVPTQQLQAGDIVLVKPHECIPVDGILVEGHSNIDETPLTAEIVPITKNIGDMVRAGSINCTRDIYVKTLRKGNSTTITHIIQQLRHGIHTRPAISKLFEAKLTNFVPAILIIAITNALIWFNLGPHPNYAYTFMTSLTILIIACPCALSLATPIATMISINKAFQKGVLIRDSASMEKMKNLSMILLDKTGVITRGKLKVSTLDPHHNWDEAQLLQLATGIEQESDHPIAQALRYTTNKLNLKPYTVTDITHIPGMGLKGTYDDKPVLLGNKSLMEQNHIELMSLPMQANHYQKNGHTVLYLSCDYAAAGLIILADPIRASAKSAIKRLHGMGFKITMLTGDNKQTADAIATSVGLDKVYSEIQPQDKIDYVNLMQQRGECVAMIGDGLLDATAIDCADIGIAMGRGVDGVNDNSDIVILGESLDSIADVIAISRQAMSAITMNLWFALLYNIIAIPIAAGLLYPFTGYLISPLLAAAMMALSSLIVILNANKLR